MAQSLEGELSQCWQMDGTKPITDRQSKMVMLRAERGDIIDVVEILEENESEFTIPEVFEVQQRVSTYYGAELLVEPAKEDSHDKFLLTAPGPNRFLYLWISETDSDGFRTGWSVGAELKARFSEELPAYPICERCGQPVKSLEHERLAAMDNCPELESK